MQDADGKPDWMMRYVPGPKAKNEFEYFPGGASVLETKPETKIEIAATSDPPVATPSEPEMRNGSDGGCRPNWKES